MSQADREYFRAFLDAETASPCSGMPATVWEEHVDQAESSEHSAWQPRFIAAKEPALS
jgi:hypothetical protein